MLIPIDKLENKKSLGCLYQYRLSKASQKTAKIRHQKAKETTAFQQPVEIFL